MNTPRVRHYVLRLGKRVWVPALAAGLVLGVSGVAGALFSVAPAPVVVPVSANVLAAPTGLALSGSVTSSSLPLVWSAPVGYAASGYSVLRCTGASCTPVPITAGGCAGVITSPGCTDNDPALTPYTTYTYEVSASFNLWQSPPSTAFSAKTLGIPTTITSANSATFVVGVNGSFTVTTTGIPTGSITNAAFSGCTPSTLPTGVTLTDNGDGTATLSSVGVTSPTTAVLCLTATNGVGTPATQVFTLVIQAPALTFTDARGNAVCASGELVVPDGGATIYVSTSVVAASAVSVGVSVVNENGNANNSPDLTGTPVTIGAGQQTSASAFTVDQPGSNDGMTLTASATGYLSATCELFKSPPVN